MSSVVIFRFQAHFRAERQISALRADKYAMQLRVGAATHTGLVRDLNEDVFLLRADEGLFVVCDGMGGSPAGEVASQLAVQAVQDYLHNGAKRAHVANGDSAGYLPQTARLADAVRKSNAFVYSEAQKDPLKAEMGTTFVGAWIAQHIVSIAHVGDSRAYLWHAQRLEPLTVDHSLVEMQIRAGLIARENSADAEDQNVLVRALGREPDVDVELTEVPVQSGDYVLLCSDGLTRMVPEPKLAEAIAHLKDPQQICDHLIAAANQNGGTDNITVVVVEVKNGWWRRMAKNWIDYVTGVR